MKQARITLAFIISALAIFNILLISDVKAEAFKSLNFSGATGLISTPTAKTGWADTSNVALDLGFFYIHDRDDSFIPMAAVQLFGKWEIGSSIDIQRNTGNDWMIFTTKFNFYNSGDSALAVGGNLQNIKTTRNDHPDLYGQFYFAFTYGGNFFSLPAETSIVIGKTIGRPKVMRDMWGRARGSRRDLNSDIDFSMGFDLDFFPNVFKHYIHWINDFANYSYSVDPNGSDARSRGCFNTGFRFAILKGNQRFKFNIDVIMTDALDTDRSFATGAVFGFTF